MFIQNSLVKMHHLFKNVFVLIEHGYSRFLIVICFWQVVTNDDDVVNALDLVVLGGVVDVFVQGQQLYLEKCCCFWCF
jgi:hypothetical protein